ncbi:MPN527 family putative ECF transporter permease subunit [Mycoplasma sp. Mirounga ES2805-ORL]|uniref:MPN527 family putative ECF transporter permease subunit n=1 Tax=Mycoplasma sp. Mirounga ES2805-ORL TaxID=754514 RepID=UPI00197BE706|nr:hypothetical protein [Mycoplasma sp. Mirounga ES2805-ORL]QSF13801.1 hypothetical protein JXZ90_00660 [Mycoplasma sp. Mirounga ES2805-ORL]
MREIESLEPNKKTNFYYKKPIVNKITMSGFLLGCMFVVNFIGGIFFVFPLASFLKFDITLVFLIICSKYIGHKYSLFLIITFFIISPLYSSGGYAPHSLLGRGILMCVQILFSSTYVLFNNLIFKKIIEKNNSLKVKIIIEIIILVLSSIITTILITILNTLVTTPLYFWLFGISKGPWVNSLAEIYSNIKAMFFGINNYYLGASSLYLLFNIINLTINSFLIFTINSINERVNFIRINQVLN